MKIAAIQIKAELANVKTNLSRAKDQIERAVTAGAELIVLPEFFTTAIGFAEAMKEAVLENGRYQVRERMKSWALEYKIMLGGSFLEFDGANAYNLFLLVLPDGTSYEHRKDIPTQFENCYYTKGDEENVLITPYGNIGVALCWEMIRQDTLSRLQGKADIILAGSCWWDLPVDAGPEREPLRRYNQTLARETPAVFARLSGIPVVHANHCGTVTSYNFPTGDRVQTRQLVGAAQVVQGDGRVVARREFSEGEGFVLADLEWNRKSGNRYGRNEVDRYVLDRKEWTVDISKRDDTVGIKMSTDGYWIPDLPDSYKRAWETANPAGMQYYEKVTLPYYRNN